MITPEQALGREALERIAEDFRSRGYDVVVGPKGTELPSFLSDATPDLIAHRANDHLVLEVKTSPRNEDAVRLNMIAKRVSQQPGWRFVLMATAPDDRGMPGKELAVMDEPSIERRLDEVRSLQEAGHHEAALMLAWAATEGILRLIAARETLADERLDTATLLRSVASEGLIGGDDYSRLNDAYRLRRALAHGFHSLPDGSQTEAKRATQSLSGISASLLGELRKSA